ncbi:MAG: hypothetical protein L0Y73_09205, partial [Candidatus Aminicenantes bacterium]|nr:hypothetical protein [Candidatus Aminicenantes bacterium]
MWKNHINYFMPPLFGGFSFLLYIVIYFPAPGSEDFVTALLVFCAGQAWSAVIILSNEKKREVLYLYLLLSILIAFLLPLFFKTFNDL